MDYDSASARAFLSELLLTVPAHVALLVLTELAQRFAAGPVVVAAELKRLASEQNPTLKTGTLYPLLRWALAAAPSGLEVPALISLLGPERTAIRLGQALGALSRHLEKDKDLG